MSFTDNKERKQSRINAGVNKISDRTFNLIMGGTVLWGVVLNVIICAIAQDQIIMWMAAHAEQAGTLLCVFIIGYLAVSIGLSMLAYKSDNPVVSFIAFTGVSAATGLLLAIYVPLFSGDDVLDAFMITAIITGIMVIAGYVYPKVFLTMGRALLFALIIMLVINICYIIVMQVTGESSTILGLIIDIVIAGIFTVYIAYDFAKSQQYTKTVDFAIDSALDIYMDVVNLFMRILSILGSSKD